MMLTWEKTGRTVGPEGSTVTYTAKEKPRITNELGYCKTTACINPKYQSNTYRTTATTDTIKNETYWTNHTEGGGE